MAITTIAGIYIRPRKKRQGRMRSITLRFALEGSVPSKKNNQVSIVDWRRGVGVAAGLTAGLSLDGAELVVPSLADVTLEGLAALVRP